MEKSLGQIGEEVAVEYLRKNGYKIIERNYRKLWGEIDIIAQKGNKIVFFEVKTLKGFNGEFSFLPEESIKRNKKIRLKKTIESYLKERKIISEYQLDVIGILFNQEKKCKLRHTKNIVVG